MSAKALVIAALLVWFPTELIGQSHQLVSIGSHRLDVVRGGTGTPAVIFEAGLGNGLDDWDPVWPSVAEFSTVVAYSRSGNGGNRGAHPLPDIPIAVLTSMRVDPAAKYVNGTARGHEAWREMHDEWFRRSHNGIHVVTTRSGHAIQAQEPELVVEAIRFVLDRVRTQ